MNTEAYSMEKILPVLLVLLLLVSALQPVTGAVAIY
jgi:hypothetical protein